MRFLRGAIIALTLGLFACGTLMPLMPSPYIMGRVDKLNTEVNQLYLDCSEGINFKPELEGCDPALLETKTGELLDLSEMLIGKDIKQPQGYDVHLAISLIYFRIRILTVKAEEMGNDYSRAEMMARQFFEIQKASSRRKSLNTARYYLAHFTAAHGSWQHFNTPEQFTTPRKADFLLAFAEGSYALPRTEGARLIRLHQALAVLETLAGFIH